MHTQIGLTPKPCSIHATTFPDSAILLPANSKHSGHQASVGMSPALLHVASFHPALTFAHHISVSTSNPI